MPDYFFYVYVRKLGAKDADTSKSNVFLFLNALSFPPIHMHNTHVHCTYDWYDVHSPWHIFTINTCMYTIEMVSRFHSGLLQLLTVEWEKQCVRNGLWYLCEAKVIYRQILSCQHKEYIHNAINWKTFGSNRLLSVRKQKIIGIRMEAKKNVVSKWVKGNKMVRIKTQWESKKRLRFTFWRIVLTVWDTLTIWICRFQGFCLSSQRFSPFQQ